MVFSMDNKKASPFSFEEISQVPQYGTQAPSFICATDGVKLAYYLFLVPNPKAVIIFYHGGGLYSNSTYQYIGFELQERSHIVSYFVDIRGHGRSEGSRGDAPSIDQVFEDVSTILMLVKSKFPHVPVYLVGHSSGAGLLLNYSTYDTRRDDLFSGYIFLAPYLGPFAGVVRPAAVSFVKKVRMWIYILNKGFKIPLFQHIPAVFFNYPKEIVLKDSLIVTEYTYTMSSATTPHDPKEIFKVLNKPTFIYVGEEDEQFVPEKVLSYGRYNENNVIKSEIIAGTKHLSILLEASDLIEKSLNI